MKKASSLLIVALLLANAESSHAQQEPVKSSYIPEDTGARFQDTLKEMDRDISLRKKARKNILRPGFAKAFEKAQTAIMADELDKAKESIEKIHNTQEPNEFETPRIHLIDYWYQGKLGNKAAENEAAKHLLETGLDKVEAPVYVEAGIRLLKRQYNSQDYGSAIDTLAYLRKEPTSQEELTSIASAVKKLDEIYASTQDIATPIKTDDKGDWTAKLLRTTFYFDKINGEITTVVFDCANKQTSITYKTDSVMATPSAWGTCSIKVKATPTTTFNFVQLTQKPAA